MSTSSQRQRSSSKRIRDRNYARRTVADDVALRSWLERVDGRYMGLPIEVDPHEALLQAIYVSAGEVAYCDKQIARLSHDELFERPLTTTYSNEGGLTRYEETRDAEVISRWVSLRDLALDRMAKYAKMALDAGVEERRVQVAERVASIMEPLLKSLADDLELTPQQMARLPQVLGTRLRALEGTATEIGVGNGRAT